MADLIGVALASITSGAAAGAAIMTSGVVTLRAMQARNGAALTADTGFAILSVTIVLGIVGAVLSGWLLGRPINDTWRRGVVAALSVFGASLLAVGATVTDMFTGIRGLSVYLALLAVAAVIAGRAARRAAHR